MVPRDSAATNTSSPKPRKTSAPVAIPSQEQIGGERVTPRVAEADPLASPSRSNISNHQPQSPLVRILQHSADDDVDDNMAAPNVARNKKRGGRRIVFWACAMVLVVVIIILIEDEAELRRSDARVKDMAWKELPENVRNQHGINGNHESGVAGNMPSNEATTMTARKESTDDDIFSNWFGRSEKDIKAGYMSTSANKSPKTTSKILKEKTKKKLQPFPVIQYDDDSIPQAVAGSILHASDALLCRDSVIDYVINATDLKDECDGLKKAFTKHCADEDEPTLTARRRRRLTKRQTLNEVQNPIARMQRHLFYLSRDLSSWWHAKDNSVFMVEDQILEAWEDAAFEVEQGWDLLYRDEDIAEILKPTTTIRNPGIDTFQSELVFLRALAEQGGDGSTKTDSRKQPRRDEEDEDEEDEEDDDESGDDEKGNDKAKPEAKKPVEETTAVQNKTVVSKDGGKHMANLALPITNKHISDKMLTETLMLQQDQKIMKAVQNQTNHTVAQADAAASKKAVSDAADMVSSVLNDPTSVEARTCCTSILNVFHETCSVDDEEELSDSRLFVTVVVIACCGLVKSLIRHFSIRWLPEAAGCILVGGEFLIVRCMTGSSKLF
jgi:hypothetical protein